jgi:hypothetical protein
MGRNFRDVVVVEWMMERLLLLSLPWHLFPQWLPIPVVRTTIVCYYRDDVVVSVVDVVVMMVDPHAGFFGVPIVLPPPPHHVLIVAIWAGWMVVAIRVPFPKRL